MPCTPALSFHARVLSPACLRWTLQEQDSARVAAEQEALVARCERLKAAVATAKAEAAAAELALYKTHIAENYITKSGLREFRDEIMHGIREVKGDLDHITDRLDRVFEVSKPNRHGNGED